MKKITCLLTLLLSIFLMSSCYTKEERDKFNEQMAIPMNSDYILVSNYGYVKDQTPYYFNNICAEYLYEVHLKNDKTDDLDWNTTSILFESHIFIRFQYYMEYEYNNSSYCYMFAIYNIYTGEFEFSMLDSSTGYQIGISKIGNYGVIIYKDSIKCIDISSKSQHSFDLSNYIIETKSDKGIVLKNTVDNNYYFYDCSLTARKLEIETDALVSNIEDNYVICYYNDNRQSFVYDLDTNTTMPYSEYNEIKNETLPTYDVIDNNEYENTFRFMINGIEHMYTMEELRVTCSEIKQVEEIFNTTVYFRHIDKINNEYYLTIGNNESFFGAYTPGSTLPMVFKIEDDFTLSYVGFLPNIHDYVRYIYKK